MSELSRIPGPPCGYVPTAEERMHIAAEKHPCRKGHASEMTACRSVEEAGVFVFRCTVCGLVYTKRPDRLTEIEREVVLAAGLSV